MNLRKIWIFMDNGTTGSIALCDSEGRVLFEPTPVRKCLNYTKSKAFTTRMDYNKTKEIFQRWLSNTTPENSRVIVLLERPMVNPGRFNATKCALRFVEAQELLMEELNLPYRFIDSKEWQKVMLPTGLAKEETKKASLDVGLRLFPQFKGKIKHDADALLGAEWARRNDI